MSGLKMKYFVLKPRGHLPDDPYAKASRMALRAYARTIEEVDEDLAKDLYEWAHDELIRDVGLVKEMKC